MKHLKIILGLAILSSAHAAYAKTSQIDYVRDITKQIDYVEKQNKVWPGFHPAATASVIQFEDGDRKSAYAINFKPGSFPWWVESGSSSPIYFIQDASVLNLKDEGKMADVDGQKSFVLLEDVKSFSPEANLVNKYMVKRASYYIAKESRIDAKHAQSLQKPFDGFNNASYIKSIYLEDAALTLAQQDDSAAAEDALRDAIAIHQYRNQTATQLAREYENANEIVKGVPVYISWTSKQLSDQDYRKMTQRTGCMPLSGMLDAKTMIGCSATGFPAFVSAVFGHALDKKIANQDWKLNVETQFKSISQTAIEFYHFTDEQAQGIAKQAMSKPAYHYDRIERVVDRSMQPYLDAMHSAVDNYNNKPGIEFRAPFEYGEVLFILSMFKEVFADYYLVDSGTTIFRDVALDIPINENGAGEHFTLENVPYMTSTLVQKDLSGEMDRELSFTGFKLSDKATLIIDGKTILASDFVRAKKVQSFTTLVVEDTDLHIPVLQKAKLDASDGILKIKDVEDNQQMVKMKMLKNIRR